MKKQIQRGKVDNIIEIWSRYKLIVWSLHLMKIKASKVDNEIQDKNKLYNPNN